MPRILALETHDVRFPTSLTLAGSDAMNPAPDYAAAYAVLRTDGPDELAGHGFAFTIGRFNDVQVAAIAALAPRVKTSKPESVTSMVCSHCADKD